MRRGWKQLLQRIIEPLPRPVHRPEDALTNDSLSVDQDPVRRAAGLVAVCELRMVIDVNMLRQ